MKSADRILAQRYSRAFDGLSATNEQARQACAQLQSAAEQLAQVAAYMQDPAVAIQEKADFVRRLFGKTGLVADFLVMLLQAKRYYLLPFCAQQVQHLLDERLGIVRAEVQTAFALPPQQQQRVEKALSQFTGKTVQAVFAVEPQLLGGLRVRMGDTLIDGSMQRQFEKLKEILTQ